jgi:hypothetical protein
VAAVPASSWAGTGRSMYCAYGSIAAQHSRQLLLDFLTAR